MVIISLGGNTKGPRGGVLRTFHWAIEQMHGHQIFVICSSSFYSSSPIGQAGQDNYINGVILVRTALSASNLLKNLKRIEAGAGRNNRPGRLAGRWGPRPLDLDIIDYKGLVSHNYQQCARTVTGTGRVLSRGCDLVLPHPHAHMRPFVIRPLMELQPLWHHPVSGLPVQGLWTSLQGNSEGRVLHKVE